QGPVLEEIAVTGLRASLEKSLDIKKSAAVVLDSINAEELGRFPDADVADSLEHLPGITITRTTGGEGQKVRRSACAASDRSTTSSRSTTASSPPTTMRVISHSTCCRRR